MTLLALSKTVRQHLHDMPTSKAKAVNKKHHKAIKARKNKARALRQNKKK